MKKVVGFIDGYNLYHGMSEEHHAWLWIDLWKLIELVAPAHDTYVAGVNYYTAPAKTQPSREHQIAFQRANKELNPALNIVDGFMQPKDRECDCPKAMAKPQRWQEKRTDVELALGLALGGVAAPPAYDIAVLVTGDADQCGAVEAARNAGRIVIVAFPPNRYVKQLDDCATDSLNISNTQIRKAQMSDCIVSHGYEIDRPNWGHRPGVDPPISPAA